MDSRSAATIRSNITKASALLEAIQGTAEEARSLLSDAEGLVDDAVDAAESHADNVEDLAGQEHPNARVARRVAEAVEKLRNEIQQAVAAAEEASNGAELGVGRIEETGDALTTAIEAGSP